MPYKQRDAHIKMLDILAHYNNNNNNDDDDDDNKHLFRVNSM